MVAQLRLFDDDTLIVVCEKCGHENHVHTSYDHLMPEIRRAYRDMGGRVYPKNVAPVIGYSEYHTREIMRTLAQTGKLKRIGARGGYMLADAI